MENLDKDFKKLAKRSKTRRHLITAGISVIGTAAVIAVAVLARNLYIKQASQAFFEQTNITNEISSPNVINEYAGQSQGLLGGTYTQTAYKNLDGIPVVLGNIGGSYGKTFGVQPTVNDSALILPFSDRGDVNFVGGQKEPNFYQIDFSVGKIFYDRTGLALPQEIKTLSKLPNHLAEVAITFDKPYTYQQIEHMIPQNLMLNWLWIGVDSKSQSLDWPFYGISTTVDTYSKGNPEMDANGNEKKVNNRNKAGNLTISSDITGLTDQMYQDYVAAVKKGQTYPDSKMLFQYSDGDKTKSYHPYDFVVKQVKKYPTLDKAKFAGVILTGKTENFAQLNNKSWLAASSVGASTENLPYLNPTD